MGELAGMGTVDYALPPLCLFYLMPKTADNFKNLGRLIMRLFFFSLSLSLLLSICCLMYPFLIHVILRSEATC